jgi:hypothetical protein
LDKLLLDEKYAFVSQKDRDFIMAFNDCMMNVGYKNNGIQPYVVFGKHKIEYFKPGNKTNKYIARIYLRDDKIVLRLYFSSIDKHSAYIEKAPDYIQKPFVDESHKCKRPNCKGIGNDKCRYQKTYVIDGITYIKCAEQSFMYHNVDAENAPGYVDLLATFYPIKKHI